MGFLKRVWYACAWTDELIDNAPLARTIAGMPLVFFRAPDGRVSALDDKCPHRLAPLSRGRITEKGIRCGYHGLEFNHMGQCIGNPHGPVTSSLRVTAYPVAERHGLIWAWLGSPAETIESTIPDLSFIDRTTPTAFIHGYLQIKADHLLMVDNILDLSHADYLHPDSLGGGSISRTKPTFEERPESLFVSWTCVDEVPLPVFRPLLPTPETRCDMWTEVEWFPNGVMILQVGAVPSGQPRQSGIDTWNAHIMTPEIKGRTHYLYCSTRNFLTEDADYNRAFGVALRTAFELEDKPMIEAQQERVGDVDLLERGPALMGIDTASVRARRVWGQRFRAEHPAA